MSRTVATEQLRVKMNAPYEQALERVSAVLKEQGFGILTQIDVQSTLKQKLGVDFRRYVILGACNPTLAHHALSATLDAGLLLPCNVVVHEDDDDGSVVAVQDPITMMHVIDNPVLQVTAKEARDRLLRVIDVLKAR